MNNTINVTSPSFGMSWTRNLPMVAKYVNNANHADVANFVKHASEAKTKMANTLYTDLYTTMNKDGQVINEVISKKPKMMEDGTIAYFDGVRKTFVGLEKFGEAIKTALEEEKLYSDRYAELKKLSDVVKS